MNENPHELEQPDTLRSDAEERLVQGRPIEAYTRSAEELLHELQVHQIELEMQNENLRESMLTLEESRDRYVDFYDFAPVGYLTLNPQGMIVEINLTGAAMLGIERSKLLQRPFSSFVAPEDSNYWRQHFIDALKHDNKQSCELDILTHSGRLHTQIDSVRLLKDQQTHPVVRIAMTDITRLKLTEAALHESAKHLRQFEQREIVQTSLDGYFIISTVDGRLLDVNDAYCHMTGYSQPELLTMCISDLNVDESPDEIAARIRKIVAVGHDRFETRHRHKKGHLIHLEASVTHSELDDGVSYVFVRDISKRKQAEELLRNSYEEIKDLYNNAACGYHSLDEHGIICRINDTELAWLGYTRDEIVGKVRLPDLMTPASRLAFQASFPRLKSRGFSHDLEVDLVRKDGSVLNGLINATAIYDSSGNYVMSRSSLTDISMLKQAEQQLHELTAHIQSVREEEKTHLAREIHDDLGGTLAALKIEANRLKRALAADKNPEQMMGCVDSMTEMIDSAMAFTRHIITDMRPSILDDLGLLAALEWQSGNFQKRTGIQCRVNCLSRNEPCELTCKDCSNKLDKTLSINLFRIFQESLSNVERHSHASRVEVGLHYDDKVTLSITDNGRGLPEGHTIAQTSYGIRGMRERAEQLGGEIYIGSPPDGGVSIKVMLPFPGAATNA